MTTTPKKRRTSAKARAMHRAPTTAKVSGPTFFENEFPNRTKPVWFCDPETGDLLEFDLSTATFTKEPK